MIHISKLLTIIIISLWRTRSRPKSIGALRKIGHTHRTMVEDDTDSPFTIETDGGKL